MSDSSMPTAPGQPSPYASQSVQAVQAPQAAQASQVAQAYQSTPVAPVQQPVQYQQAPVAPSQDQAQPIYAQYPPVQPAQPVQSLQPGQPAQPYAAAPAVPQAPAQKSPFSIGAVAQWTVFSQILRGHTIPALNIAHSSSLFWAAHVAIFAGIVGLFYATTIARISAAATSFADDLLDSMSGGLFSSSGYSSSDYFGLDFGEWFQLFIYAALLYVAYFFIRSLCVWAVCGIRKQSVPFSVAATNVASAYTGQLVLTALLFILVLVPSTGFVSFVTFIGIMLYGLLSYLSELLLYTAINRSAPFAKSPLMPHVLLTGVSMTATFLAFTALTYIFAV
ncbi:hypothetical protein [Rothia sp. 32237D007AR]